LPEVLKVLRSFSKSDNFGSFFTIIGPQNGKDTHARTNYTDFGDENPYSKANGSRVQKTLPPTSPWP